MAGLEATLVIGAKDQTGATLAALRRTIDALSAHIEQVDKLTTAVARASKSNDPFVASLSATQKALAEQRASLAALGAGLEGLAGPTDAAAAAQGKLLGAVERTTEMMAAQGAEALRAAEKVAKAQQVAARAGAGGAGGGGGLRKAIGDNLPFLGPGILHETVKAAEAGASIQDEIAALTAAGATPEQIAKARAEFVDFSKIYAGVSEADYLAAYKDARTIAPGEPYEMTRLGMKYRIAARNSGVPTSEADVSNVLRIMDELGLKTMPERENLLNSILKSQQAFGSQISSETMLAAYRNAKQSIYDWSPEFREKLFPTLLQSAGQQGGTEMMTALNNYIGQHMQLSELKKLIGAGFVNNSDLIWTHNKPLLKPNAHLFESDLFQSNIAQWAWDFHEHYMKRKGATEGGFKELVDAMPRSMAGLISFLVHNEARLKREETTVGLPVGLGAADNSYMSQNPAAALDALKTSLTQFGAAVTSPPMTEIGAGLAALAKGIQAISGAYSEFATAHPDAAKAAGAGALAGGAATGGWLTWKLFTGLGRLLGFGGGGATADVAAAAGGTAAGGAALGLGGVVGGGAAVFGAGAAVAGLLEALGPDGPLAKFYRLPTAEDKPTEGDLERSRRARLVWHGGAFVDDPEAATGRAYSKIENERDQMVKLDPASKATVEVSISVSPSAELAATIAAAHAAAAGNLDAHLGTMDTDAKPHKATIWGPHGYNP